MEHRRRVLRFCVLFFCVSPSPDEMLHCAILRPRTSPNKNGYIKRHVRGKQDCIAGRFVPPPSMTHPSQQHQKVHTMRNKVFVVRNGRDGRGSSHGCLKMFWQMFCNVLYRVYHSKILHKWRRTKTNPCLC